MGKVLEAAFHPDPAGGAARASAAYGSVRHVLHAADLEQGRAGRHAHRRATAIGHLDPRARGTPHDAHQGNQQGQSEQGEECLAQPIMQGRQPVGRCAMRRAGGRLQFLPGAGLGDLGGHLPACHGEAGQGSNRQRHGERKQRLARVLVPGGQPQPVVDADAAVHPHHQQQRAVLERERGPDIGKLVGIGVVGAGQAGGAAIEHHVGDEEQRDREPADDLRGFPDRHLPGEPGRQLVEREQDVGDECAEQDDGAGPRARHHLAPVLHRLHRIDADEAQRVIEKMRGGKGEQDEAGCEPQPLQYVAACQDVHRLLAPLLCGPDHRGKAACERGLQVRPGKICL